MAGDPGIHAEVVQRSCQDRYDDGAGAGAARQLVVVPALSGRDRPDDQPDGQQDRTESHEFSSSSGMRASGRAGPLTGAGWRPAAPGPAGAVERVGLDPVQPGTQVGALLEG